MLIPPPPDGSTWTEAEVPSRFEDVTQDGRLQLTAMLHGLGRTTWRALLKQPASQALFAQGIVPILTRLVIHGEGGPFSVDPNPRARGTFAFSHVPSDKPDQAERILLGMWLEISAPIGVMYGPPPDRAGDIATAGRVYAEHTLTRPFGSPGERRVGRLDAEGVAALPGPAVTRVRPADVIALPADAAPLDPTPVADATPFVFGLSHTDPNQHVNSLVYLRLFEEAALRRLAEHGKRGEHLARRVEIVYVKPSFAGNEVRVILQAYERDGRPGATGVFVPEGATPDKATCFVHIAF